jgi:hypothetical protein
LLSVSVFLAGLAGGIGLAELLLGGMLGLDELLLGGRLGLDYRGRLGIAMYISKALNVYQGISMYFKVYRGCPHRG